jgi:hypothetical protein
MACGLSRAELTRFNISLDENQRCQARCLRSDGGESVCNSLLSEHVQDKGKSNPSKPSGDENEAEVDAADESGSSTFCGRLSKRVLQGVQVMLVTYLAVSFFIVMFASGINFEIATSEISNIMISSTTDSLQFWFRASSVGLSFIAYEDGSSHDDKEIENMYLYSSVDLDDYNCNLDASCENTVDDLSKAWHTLLISSSLCALLCIVSWFLAAPRNVYPCLYNTKMYQTVVREEKTIFLWFIKPGGLTYLLVSLYSVAFGVQFVALFKYVNHLPSKEDMYRLSLHYMNSDQTLCSVSNPCEFSFESIYNFNRNVSFMFASLVCVAIAVVLVALSHRLELKSLRWHCFCSCCTEAQQVSGGGTHDGNSSSVPTEDLENAPHSDSALPTTSDYSMDKGTFTRSSSYGPLIANVVGTEEVQMTEIDLRSDC